MEAFTLTRKEMADLLLALHGQKCCEPLQVLQQAWKQSHRDAYESGSSLPAFLSTELPSVLVKLIKGREVKGFSLQEISALGGLIDFSQMSITSMQNWVKRDFKPYFDCPKIGKKYSLNQTALLFIIDDLKSSLDFGSIRKLFDRLFNKPEDETDDLIGPLELYAAYTAMYEELAASGYRLLDMARPYQDARDREAIMEQMLHSASEPFLQILPRLSEEQTEALRHILFIAVISIRTSYFHSLAKRYCHATLFLNP
ncbi:DUF1836 domain-containing protein [Paenibacillus glycanilyticus]|uniref:DUF1836 domain-containing protein n=1 Tax=Paenibacillus glycanilyticus TaxID=126569 RepID=UPI0020420A7E|nr:DUF1836 domain-containing protein [Paenibacillus glycanilyticus]MCM3627645.1 DUF1836 domain-containing protein [Paenibacillus glycanilyticus]